MADLGFRISQDGIDVKTGNDKDMVITSKYSNLKGAISGGGIAEIPYADADNRVLVTIAHNLGYIPMVRVLADIYNSGVYHTTPVAGGGMAYDFGVTATADATNLYIDVYGIYYDESTFYLPYKYFIFLDKGKL